jgi:hypothetical protein
MQVASCKHCSTSLEKLVWKVWQVELWSELHLRYASCIKHLCMHPHQWTCLSQLALRTPSFNSFESGMHFDESLHWLRFTFVSLFLFTAPPPSQSTYNSSVHPLQLRCSSNILRLTKARCYGCNGTYQHWQVTAAVHLKNIAWFHYFFSEMIVWADHCYCTFKELHITFITYDYSGNIVSQDQEFWTTEVGKLHFEEWCIQYNYALFIWAIYRGQK